jgi:hypothetical protein
MTEKPVNQKAWFLILPVLVCVAFSAILPLMTVVNYSVQDIISPERRVFVGTEWFAAVMRDQDLHAALWNQLKFSAAVLLVQIPLGIALALAMPASGWKASATLVLVALSLLIPWNVVGTIWQIFGRTDIGLMGATLQRMGIDYSYRAAQHSRCLLPSRAHRRRQQVRCVSLHPAAQDARRADDRGAAAFHGQFHDLHRALRAHRRRPWQCHHLPQPVPDAKGGGPVRSGASGGFLADLFLHHLVVLLHSLQLDAATWPS